MPVQYLFRDGLITDRADSSSYIDSALKGDYLLCFHRTNAHVKEFWSSYQMVFFDPSYGWLSQPPDVTQQLRTHLLIQQ